MQITIIGMGQIGCSIGLALQGYQNDLTIVGYDKNLDRQKFAKSIGACVKTFINMHDAVEGADLVILATPYTTLPTLFGQLKESIKQGCVIISTAPNKKFTSALIKENFPEDTHFIGLTPSFNPQYIRILDPGDIIEKSDLFSNTTLGISAPAGTNETALKYASDLVRLLGAKVYYLDLLEADGIERNSNLLPSLASFITLTATFGQPGWNDTRDTISQSYLNLSAAYGYENPQDLARSILDEKENALAILDRLTSQANELRRLIEQEDEKELVASFEKTHKSKQYIFEGRKTGNWEVKDKPDSKPDKKTFLKELFFGSREK